MPHDPASQCKVLFRVSYDDGSSQVETLWANALGQDEYVLDNSPFYAYAVSWKDTVLAPFDASEGMPTFERIVTKSGHRTLRIMFDPPVHEGNRSDALLQGLVALGCSYEGQDRTYMSIDLPPDVSLDGVCAYLVEHDAQWEHADPTFESLYPTEE